MSSICFDFAITSFCQAKCRSCVRTNSDTGEQEQWLTPRHVPFVKWKKHTTNLNDKNNIDYVKFCGQTGDPMMHPDITKFVDHAFTVCNNIMISTNGGLRSPDWYTEMGNKYGEELKIVFAIDGMDHETNWKYREGVNFDKAWNNMVAYANSDGYTQWDFLVFDWNWQQIPIISKMAKSIGVDDLNIKINTAPYGLLNPKHLSRVKEMICQANIT